MTDPSKVPPPGTRCRGERRACSAIGAARGGPGRHHKGDHVSKVEKVGFVLSCALAVAGCAPKGASGPPRTFDPQAMTFLSGLTPHQEGRVREAWAFYLERWNRDEGPVAPWRSVTIVPGAEVRPGVGGEVRDGRRVFIASDSEEVATAVYHELGHLRLMDEGTDGDPQHLDPRWTVWQARRQQAVFDLIDWRVARYGRSGP